MKKPTLAAVMMKKDTPDPPAAAPTASTVTGSDRISTTLHIDRPINGFTLYCILEDISGKFIFHQREESNLMGLRDLAAGKYEIKVQVPPIWLNPGLYSLHFKIFFWGEYGSTRHVSDKLMLDVAGASSTTTAILHPEVAWSFQPKLKPVAEAAAQSSKATT